MSLRSDNNCHYPQEVLSGEYIGTLYLRMTISLPKAAAYLLLDLLSDLAKGRAVSLADREESGLSVEELLNQLREGRAALAKDRYGEAPTDDESTTGSDSSKQPGAVNE